MEPFAKICLQNSSIVDVRLDSKTPLTFCPCLSLLQRELPLDEEEAPSSCHSEGAYPPKSFNHSASTRRAQLSVAAKVIRSTDLLNHNVKTRVNTDKTWLERPSLVKAPFSVECQFACICLCAAAEWLPRLVRRKVAMLRAFTVGF